MLVVPVQLSISGVPHATSRSMNGAQVSDSFLASSMAFVHFEAVVWSQGDFAASFPQNWLMGSDAPHAARASAVPAVKARVAVIGAVYSGAAVPRFSIPRLVATCVVCAGALLCACAAGVAFGGEPLSLAEAFTPQTPAETIFFSLRVPRVALAALVGMALAASGNTLQALMRNPLADPFVLGVSGGAALGATIALALGMSLAAVPGLSAVSALALAGAIGATLLVMAVGRLAGKGSPHTTLLAGVIFNAFALAAIIFIKALVAPDKVGEVLFWLAGALGYEKPLTLWVTGVVQVVAVGLMWMWSGRLNLLMLGDEDAASLGVSVGSTRRALLVVASLSVAAAVALSGLVGFVGLLVPHLARLALGPDQRLTLPASALLGGAFLVMADLGARVLFRVFHTEPPVGVITALIGGPAFLALLLRSRAASP